MLFVTVVGLYFGSVRWIPLNFHRYPFIPWLVFMLGSIGIYLIYLEHGLKLPSSTHILILASGFSIPAAQIIGEFQQTKENYAIVFHYGSWSSIFIISIAAIISVIHCKKQTGSWLPFVGERAEGENNE